MSSAYDPFFDESDLDEPNYYCKHGTFIGNPYGADYMCGYCEDGIEDKEYIWMGKRSIVEIEYEQGLRMLYDSLLSEVKSDATFSNEFVLELLNNQKDAHREAISNIKVYGGEVQAFRRSYGYYGNK